MKIDVIVQARCSSTRLPNKVLMKLDGTEMILLILERIKGSKNINDVIVATTTDETDDKLCSLLTQNGYKFFRGDKNDVLSRFYLCASELSSDWIVRITADCPLVDYKIIDRLIEEKDLSDYDYLSNTIVETYPDGLDVELFSYLALERAQEKAHTKYEREHVTPYMKKNEKVFSLINVQDYSQIRVTVDERMDYDLVSIILKENSRNMGFNELISFYQNNKDLFNINSSIKRNEGSLIGTGQKLWKRAKNVIPGGNHLLSKRPEMFLPETWPSYFDKTEGKYVYDLDGVKYLDMSIMGIGTNSLGYNDPDVDSAVMNIIKKGNMSTFNCPEEVEFLEKLIAIHPWSKMGRLTRSGGEANAVAIRIARVASNKDVVAVCGYHGWHDWYLSVNQTKDDGLAQHLLPGLSTSGVPKSLAGNTVPFFYNNIESLYDVINKYNVGVIKMEVMRNYEPQNNFLQQVRDVATKKGIVLIFDECTSGFREVYGGLHLKYGVEPDMAVFGKAIGNGYALNAVIGKEEIMKESQKSFISSTFWTERIGPTAGIATLDKMKKINSAEYIKNIGAEMKKIWRETADKNGINIKIFGLDSLATFTFEENYSLEMKTFLTQEMLKKNILAGNTFYASTQHDPNDLKIYSKILDKIFKKIKRFKNGEIKVEEFIDVKVCHGGFKRLN